MRLTTDQTREVAADGRCSSCDCCWADDCNGTDCAAPCPCWPEV